MRILLLSSCLFSLVSFSGCSNHSKVEVNNTLFSVNYDINYQDLVQNGYDSVLDVDVLLMHKTIDDSTYYQYFLRNSHTVLSKSIFVTFHHFNLRNVNKYIQNNGGLIITTLCENMDNDFIDFFVEGGPASLYFRCRLERKENGEALLEMEHRFPSYYLKED